MTRFKSLIVALAAFSILTLGGFSVSEAAKKHAKTRKAGEIKVKVVDHSGKPVAGAKVHLRKVVKHHKKKKPAAATAASTSSSASTGAVTAAKKKHKHKARGRTAVTNSEGIATFAHVKPGRHRAIAEKKSKGRGSARVSLKAGQSKTVTIHLGAKKHKHSAVAAH